MMRSRMSCELYRERIFYVKGTDTNVNMYKCPDMGQYLILEEMRD